MGTRRWLSLLVAAFAAACGGCAADENETGPIGPAPTGTCQPGELTLGDGSCLAAGDGAGIPPELCGAGFVADGAEGCAAVLPANGCPEGQMAVPGEAACRQVAACGEGPWGDVPVEPDSQYVDGAYPGGDSDGSAERPWVTIQQAIDAAAPAGLVAIASGVYAEAIDFGGKTVRLWGRCPDLVEIRAPDGSHVVRLSGAGSEVHTLALTGGEAGLDIDAPGALVDRLWIHHTGRSGIQTAADTTIAGTLIEQAAYIGLFVSGAMVTVADSVVRASESRGINVENAGDVPAAVTLSGSVLEQNHESALWAQASQVLVERCVIRDTAMGGAGYESGSAIYAQVQESLGMVAEVSVVQSVFERNHNIGIDIWGASVSLHATVVRDTQPNSTGRYGRGLEVANEPDTGQMGTATITQSVIAGNRDVGIMAAGAVVTLDRAIVRDTEPIGQEAQSGNGVIIQRTSTQSTPSVLTVTASLIERNHVTGVFASGASFTIEQTRIRDIFENVGTGLLGRAITVTGQTATDEERTVGVVRNSVLERCRELGALVGGSADLRLEATHISDILPQLATGIAGWGAAAQEAPELGGRPSLHVTGCLIERVHEHGLAALAADLDVADTVVREVAPRELDGLSGDGIVFGAGSAPAAGSVVASRVANNARLGVGSWGSAVVLRDDTFDCNPIDLNGEIFEGTGFSFDDEGGNVCGCGSEQWACAARSTQLAPPQPLD